jgi:hypothetical protein
MCRGPQVEYLCYKDRESAMFECRLLSIRACSIWVCIFPSGEVRIYLRYVVIWEHYTLLTTGLSDVTNLSYFIITIFMETIISDCWFENILLSLNFYSNPLKKFHVTFRELIQYTHQFLVKIVPFITHPMGTRGYFPGGKAAGAWSWPLTSI